MNNNDDKKIPKGIPGPSPLVNMAVYMALQDVSGFQSVPSYEMFQGDILLGPDDYDKYYGVQSEDRGPVKVKQSNHSYEDEWLRLYFNSDRK